MSTFLINIVANSDFAAVITRDTEAVSANTAALEANSAALVANSGSTAGVEASRTKLKRATQSDTSTTTLTDRIRTLHNQLLRLSGAQDTVGYNFMGLSLRIGQWVIPALVLLVSSMLPVIAGLLAMGAAAGVAGVGLVGALGLGAMLLSHRMTNAGQLNQPEGFGANQTSIWTTLFKPSWAALDSPQLKGVTDNAVFFIKALFGDTIPNALRNFLSHIDPGTMMVIEQMFTNWLPNAAAGLSTWGSRIFNVIGPGTLTRLNAFFKYLANGVESAAVWLATGGWEQMDNVSDIVVDVISTLLDLGKNALPVLLTAANQIWPFPLKYMLEAMGKFFDNVNRNKDALDTLATLTWLVVVLIALNFVAGLVAVVLGALTSELVLDILLIVAVFTAFYVAVGLLEEVLFRTWWIIKTIAIFLYDVVISFFEALITGIWNLLTGDDLKPTNRIKSADAYWDIMTGKGTAGEKELAWTWAQPGKIAGGAWGMAKSALHVVFHPDGVYIDKIADEQADKELGSNMSWEVANGQFSRGAYA